jgi:hypothetical protein
MKTHVAPERVRESELVGPWGTILIRYSQFVNLAEEMVVFTAFLRLTILRFEKK